METDIGAFNFLVAMGVTAQSILILFPFAGSQTYIANFVFVMCASGWYSCWVVILLTRAPPKKKATFLLLSRTISVGAGISTPWIVTLPKPLPHMITLAFSLIGFFASRFLPLVENSAEHVVAAHDNTIASDWEKDADTPLLGKLVPKLSPKAIKRPRT